MLWFLTYLPSYTPYIWTLIGKFYIKWFYTSVKNIVNTYSALCFWSIYKKIKNIFCIGDVQKSNSKCTKRNKIRDHFCHSLMRIRFDQNRTMEDSDFSSGTKIPHQQPLAHIWYGCVIVVLYPAVGKDISIHVTQAGQKADHCQHACHNLHPQAGFYLSENKRHTCSYIILWRICNRNNMSCFFPLLL